MVIHQQNPISLHVKSLLSAKLTRETTAFPLFGKYSTKDDREGVFAVSRRKCPGLDTILQGLRGRNGAPGRGMAQRAEEGGRRRKKSEKAQALPGLDGKCQNQAEGQQQQTKTKSGSRPIPGKAAGMKNVAFTETCGRASLCPAAIYAAAIFAKSGRNRRGKRADL